MITPQTVFAHPHWFVLDVRPADERFGQLGFIPGSIWVDPADTSFENTVLEMASKHPVVLTCLSGKRSQAHQEQFKHYATGAPIEHMQGGLLLWKQHYPVAGLHVQPQDVSSTDPQALYLNLRACFIGQMTESMLDLDEASFEDPVKMLEACFREVGVAPEDATARHWHQVLDQMAHLSKSKQTPLEDIARHVDEFLGWFPKGLTSYTK